MRPVELRIDHIGVELTSELRPREVEATLRAALELLARGLARAPLGGDVETRARAIELLELGPLASDRLTGPGAAARLADELYEEIARKAG